VKLHYPNNITPKTLLQSCLESTLDGIPYYQKSLGPITHIEDSHDIILKLKSVNVPQKQSRNFRVETSQKITHKEGKNHSQPSISQS